MTRRPPTTDTALASVHITLAALSHELAGAWREAFADIPTVTVHHGDLFALDADALVSPANSFGFMDGGLDLLLSQRLGWHVEQRVRDRILDEHDGELPVGQALVVATDHPRWPWLVSAPTMRVPMRVEQTANAHLAMRGILRAVRDHNARADEADHARIGSILCPGLGTGEGRMPATQCARQMRAAYDAIVHGQLVRKGGLAGAVRHHLDMLGLEQP